MEPRNHLYTKYAPWGQRLEVPVQRAWRAAKQCLGELPSAVAGFALEGQAALSWDCEAMLPACAYPMPAPSVVALYRAADAPHFPLRLLLCCLRLWWGFQGSFFCPWTPSGGNSLYLGSRV